MGLDLFAAVQTSLFTKRTSAEKNPPAVLPSRDLVGYLRKLPHLAVLISELFAITIFDESVVTDHISVTAIRDDENVAV